VSRRRVFPLLSRASPPLVSGRQPPRASLPLLAVVSGARRLPPLPAGMLLLPLLPSGALRLLRRPAGKPGKRVHWGQGVTVA